VCGEGKTVLIVDDEFAIVEALTEALAWEGYAVKSASDGRAALDLLGREQVDAVLMDLMMPVMSGLETIEAMKRDPRMKDIPVVIMSAGPLPAHDALFTGALRKPFDIAQLLATVRSALDR
jgi:CheY-like chemotaxis protein